jgi:hypothetical protein
MLLQATIDEGTTDMKKFGFAITGMCGNFSHHNIST